MGNPIPIHPSDYCTPLACIPIQQTSEEAETADEAWEKFVTGPGAANRDWYYKEEIYEAQWLKRRNL